MTGDTKEVKHLHVKMSQEENRMLEVLVRGYPASDKSEFVRVLVAHVFRERPNIANVWEFQEQRNGENGEI